MTTTLYQTAAFHHWLTTEHSAPTRIFLARTLDQLARGKFGNISSSGVINTIYKNRNFAMFYALQMPHPGIVMLGNGEVWRGHNAKQPQLNRFDMAEYLHSQGDILIYLQMLLESHDPAEIDAGLGHAIRARERINSHNIVPFSKKVLKEISDNLDIDDLLKLARKLSFRLHIEQDGSLAQH